MASERYTIGIDHGGGADWCSTIVMTSDGAPTGTLYIVPPRRDGESEEDWITRCAVITGIGPDGDSDDR